MIRSAAVKTMLMCLFGSWYLAPRKTRKKLELEVGQLEVQLNRAGEGVKQEKDEMEAVLLRLSRALEGVDVQLTKSAVRHISPVRFYFCVEEQGKEKRRSEAFRAEGC